MDGNENGSLLTETDEAENRRREYFEGLLIGGGGRVAELTEAT